MLRPIKAGSQRILVQAREQTTEQVTKKGWMTVDDIHWSIWRMVDIRVSLPIKENVSIK